MIKDLIKEYTDTWLFQKYQKILFICSNTHEDDHHMVVKFI